jgi:hypothetical protein
VPSTSNRARAIAITRALLIADVIVGVVALALIPTVEIRTVLLTGPILLLAGFATAVAAGKAKYHRATLIGLAYCAMCIFLIALVNILDWSPERAVHPFEAMGLVFDCSIAAATVYVLRHPPPIIEPWSCLGCGYLLYGLPEPRCPECGRAFDPATFAGSAAGLDQPA